MVRCTKYYCDNCVKEVKLWDDIESTWFGNNSPKFHGTLWTCIPGINEKQIEPFPRLELGSLCKTCFEDAKARLKAWKENNNLKKDEVEC